MKKLILIDGHSLAFRAFYALPPDMRTAAGKLTNAVYGFTSMLRKIIAEMQPDYLAVAFDKGSHTFRNEIYSEYKGTRSKMPEELREQIGYIEEVLSAWNIKQLSMDNYEADDIIGTIAREAELGGETETYIISGDRDLFQLVAPNTTVFYTRRGITDMEEMTEAEFLNQYGLMPERLVDLKALMGDSSDNIPGVKGVGEKTALKLLKEYHTLEGVLENIDKVSGNALKRNLLEGADSARMSYRLAEIDRKVPVEWTKEELVFDGLTPEVRERVLAIYQELEFNTFGRELREKEEEPVLNLPIFIKSLSAEAVSKHDKKPLYFLFTDEELLLLLSGEVYSAGSADKSLVQSLMEDAGLLKITHESKLARHRLADLGINVEGLTFDTELAAYLLDPTDSGYSLANLCRRYLTEYSGESEFSDLLRLLPSLHSKLLAEMEQYALMNLYRDVEMPLSEVLFKMEHRGIRVEGAVLRQLGEQMVREMAALEKQIYMEAGEEFNINSPKQLGFILFEKLGLPPIKKTKTGYSTAQEVLEELAPAHKLPKLIISYRQLSKLNSTYIEGLLPLIGEDERIHTTFNQTVTATGRLSSADPNLQNIPIRMEEGRLIRRAFTAGRDYDYLLSADYSQIELRILAEMSGDDLLQTAFRDGEDIHTRTAAEVFSLAPEEVDFEHRSRAKAVNFGIVYGQTDYGLARELGITRGEAANYIEKYFARYPGVKEYMNRMIMSAKTKGYVETMLHRRRYLPDINDRSFHRRAFAERTAINTPIQGTAADLIKTAMVKLEKALTEGGFKSRLLLQVHDELVLEVPKDELNDVAKLLDREMRNSLKLSVPVIVDLRYGKDWYEMEALPCPNCPK